ncbi:MAG: GNAT family protein [Alcaligenaceae bacterium]|nr:GNAT family protein [Alcaligenaceae bacterium]
MMVQGFNTPLKEIRLEGFGIVLEALKSEHAADLAVAAADGELWNLHYTSVPAPGDEATYIAKALEQQAAGTQLPFVLRQVESGRIIGTTRYHDIEAELARLEIGYTWYAKSAQRTHVNTAAKYLLLRHAFDILQANIVGWRTDSENLVSQAAITRIGGLRTGIMRGSRLRRDGSIGDSVHYSMSHVEWPQHRQRLEAILAQQ